MGEKNSDGVRHRGVKDEENMADMKKERQIETETKEVRVWALKGGRGGHRAVLRQFVGKCLRDGSLLTEFLLIHESQKKPHRETSDVVKCVCVYVWCIR